MAENVGKAFIPYYDHLINIMDTSPALRNTANGFITQFGWAAAGMIAGAVVAGPVGFAVGLVAGGLVGLARGDDYDSLITVLKNLSSAEQAELVRRVQGEVGSVAIDALTLYVCDTAGCKALIRVLISFVSELAKGL